MGHTLFQREEKQDRGQLQELPAQKEKKENVDLLNLI